MDAPAPVFRAMTTSTRPIYQLLRCISFANKVHVDISEDGVKFIADHTRVMQGMASLGKSLFASYAVQRHGEADHRHHNDDDDDAYDDDDEADDARFQIALPALLEALQIFGVTDAPASRPFRADADAYRSGTRGGSGGGGGGGGNNGYGQQTGHYNNGDVFSHQVLGMPGTCTLSYAEQGSPLSIVLEEASVRTTCNLATYVPEALEEIPFDRDALVFKLILQPRWLLDALVELAPASPNLLTLTVTQRAPYLRLTSQGQLGSASVGFSRGRGLFESLWVGDRWSQSFKFDLIKAATEAMRLASKVSIRGDRQGVLSLQFMVEMDGGGGGGGGGGADGGSVGGGGGGGGGMQWLQFLFVPFMTDDDDDEDDDDEDDDDAGDDDNGNGAGANDDGDDDSVEL